MNRDEINKMIDNCEANLSCKELHSTIDFIKKIFPDCKIKYKSKDSKIWIDNENENWIDD